LDDSLITALGITIIGMSLLFLSLVFFYGLLSFLTATIKDRSSTSTHPPDEEGGEAEIDHQEKIRVRAAALAIALARAEAEQRPGFAILPAPHEAVTDQPSSPWWNLHHQRLLSLNPDRRRSR
jgi:Na+-transporting methylmalonyl-CoA/oxaloacetate decarboxylase gamma subunit